MVEFIGFLLCPCGDYRVSLTRPRVYPKVERGTYQGMMIAIPEENWGTFSLLTIPQLARLMIYLAENVRLSAFKKHPRGPKKKPPKRSNKKTQPHVSTAKLVGLR